jgi:hypothetical protein
MKNKSKINFIIDAIMLVALILIAGIGFLIKFVLIPGSKRNLVYGADVDLFFLNMDRHQWGTIHLIISFFFLFLILLHIILHWNQIVCIYKRLIKNKTLRAGLTSSIVILIFLFGIGHLFLKPEMKDATPKYRNRRQNAYIQNNQSARETRQQQNNIPSVTKEAERYESGGNHKSKEQTLTMNEQEKEHTPQHRLRNQVEDIEVYGYMTLNEAAAKYHVKATELADAMGIPAHLTNERLGRLRKHYNFSLGDVKKYIVTHSK